MLRSTLIALFTYIILDYVFLLSFGYFQIPWIGTIPISMIIGISTGMIEYYYRISIPEDHWKPWDVLAMIIITITLSYGYLNLFIHFELIIIFCFLSLLSYYILKVSHYYLYRKSQNRFIDLIQAYRNHFAVPIIVAFMFIPVSVTLNLFDENNFSQIKETEFPFSTDLSRETLINEYLIVKYPDLTSFEYWSEDRIIDFLQDIEYIEANECHRNPAEIQSDLLKDSTYAYYSFSDNLIKINSIYLKSRTPFEWIDSILHEGRHSYQFQLIMQINWDDPIVLNSPQFSEFNKIFQEFMDYNDGSEGEFETYYNQFIEVDARQFSDEILPIYIVMLLAP